MKWLAQIIILIVLIAISWGCGPKKNVVNQAFDDNSHTGDSLFIEFVTLANETETIVRLDSLINTGWFSEHKTGLLYYQKGVAQSNLGKYVDAEGSILRSKSLFSKEPAERYLALCNILLCDVNLYLDNKDLALQYIQEALTVFRKLNDKAQESRALNSLAYAYFEFKDMGMAIETLKKAARIQAVLKDTSALSACYNNLGQVLEEVGDVGLGLSYYEKANKFALLEKPQNTYPLRNLGAYYLSVGHLQKSKQHYIQALDIEKEQKHYSQIKEIYDQLLKIAIQNNDFSEAILYQKARDSIYQVSAKIESDEKYTILKNQYKMETSAKELEQKHAINAKNRIIFLIFLGLMILSGLFFFQRSKHKNLKLIQEKMRLEQSVLRSQMNPHFIYNALSAIQNTLLDNDPIKSATYLSRFAKLIRQNFDFVNQKSILLAEEIDALKNYLDTQSLRFEDKFDYEINIYSDVNIDSVTIPPLLLQPFIENAIEHGFRNKKEKGKIVISISRKGDRIVYSIWDNGVGFTSSAKDGKMHAIDVFKKRLILLGNKDEKTFNIESSESGTTVHFSLKEND